MVARKGPELRELDIGAGEIVIRKRASGDSESERPETCPQKQRLVGEGPRRGCAQISTPPPEKQRDYLVWLCNACFCRNSDQHIKL